MAKVAPPVYSTAYIPHPTEKMKAAQWMGPKDIQLGTVPKPMITAPRDAIVRVTHCTICGSDLHMYCGALNEGMEKGDIMGHEAIGYVEEVGPGVSKTKVGDRVIILPVIACGDCEYCLKQEYSLCDGTNPSKQMKRLYGHRLSGIFGYSHLTGGYPGNQAEFCRVPNADLTLVKAPKDVEAKKLLALADVTDTAWHGCELGEVGEGDVVGVWGCGAIGLSIQRLSMLRGAARVYAVDVDTKRLAIAEKFGMIPIDANIHQDVANYLLELEPRGLDRSIEASGFRSAQSYEHKVMMATRKGGNMALIGDFFFNTNHFPIGPLMEKTITLRGGQLMAQRYYPFLLNLVVMGKYDPSFVFTHEDKLENISQCYEQFFTHTAPGGLKVMMTTAAGRKEG